MASVTLRIWFPDLPIPGGVARQKPARANEKHLAEIAAPPKTGRSESSGFDRVSWRAVSGWPIYSNSPEISHSEREPVLCRDNGHRPPTVSFKIRWHLTALVLEGPSGGREPGDVRNRPRSFPLPDRRVPPAPQGCRNSPSKVPPWMSPSFVPAD